MIQGWVDDVAGWESATFRHAPEVEECIGQARWRKWLTAAHRLAFASASSRSPPCPSLAGRHRLVLVVRTALQGVARSKGEYPVLLVCMMNQLAFRGYSAGQRPLRCATNAIARPPQTDAAQRASPKTSTSSRTIASKVYYGGNSYTLDEVRRFARPVEPSQVPSQDPGRVAPWQIADGTLLLSVWHALCNPRLQSPHCAHQDSGVPRERICCVSGFAALRSLRTFCRDEVQSS
jgi:hypothetical protein